jgi:hypothetical protein
MKMKLLSIFTVNIIAMLMLIIPYTTTAAIISYGDSYNDMASFSFDNTLLPDTGEVAQITYKDITNWYVWPDGWYKLNDISFTFAIDNNRLGGVNVGIFDAYLSTVNNDEYLYSNQLYCLSSVCGGDIDVLSRKNLVFHGSTTHYVSSYWKIDTSTSEIPEPSTIALIGLGLLGFVATHRKK